MRQVVLILMIVPMMLQGIELKIHRNMTCNDKKESTIGILYIDGEKVGRTLELPWRNNENRISRIEPGYYKAKMRNDGSRSWRIELLNVKDRKYIQIHVGNYPSQIEGCILVGDDVTYHKDKDQCMVTNSAQTITKIRELIAKSAEDEYMQMTHGNVDIKVIVE